MANPHDRCANEPGGMECMECGVIFIGAEWHTECAVCAGVEEPRIADHRNNPLSDILRDALAKHQQ